MTNKLLQFKLTYGTKSARIMIQELVNRLPNEFFNQNDILIKELQLMALKLEQALSDELL